MRPNVAGRKKLFVRGFEELGEFADVIASFVFDAFEIYDLDVEVGQ